MLSCNLQPKIACLFLCFSFSILFASNSLAQQNKIIEAVDIYGNRLSSDEEILKHIKTRPGQQLNEKQLQEDLQALLKLGLFNPKGTRFLTEEGLRGGINVIFEIQELPIIAEVKFKGLRHISKEEIILELNQQKANVAVEKPFDLEKLNEAKKIISDYLIKQRGLISAKVETNVEFVSATTVNVVFVIEETSNDDEEDCCPNSLDICQNIFLRTLHLPQKFL